MRFPDGRLAGAAALLIVSLVGCSGSAPAPARYHGLGASSANSSLTTPASSSQTATASSSQTAPAPETSTSVGTSAAEPETNEGARNAAARFYRLNAANRFSASWGMLSPTAKRAIRRAIWIGVHNGCQPTGAGRARVIKSVLVFGNAAIVTETIVGTDSRLGKAEDVFNYVSGRWGYMPNNLTIFHHGSVAADIGSARALGFCTGREASPL